MRSTRAAAGLILSLLCALGARAEEGLTLRTEVDLSAEYKFRSEESLIEDPERRNGLDFRRDYLDRAPLARLSFEYGAPRGLGLAVESKLRRQWYGDFFRASNLVDLGAEGNPLAVENKFFSRGLLSWRSPTLDLHFGRDRVDLNQGLEGGLLPSARLPYYDAFRAQGRLGPLTMDWMVATIQARKSWEYYEYGRDSNYDVKPNEGLSADFDPDGLEPAPYGWEDGVNPTIIAEALHRFSWDFGALSLGVTGHTMMARRNNRFVLTDFFPVISWHQTGVLQTNNSMVLDLSWEPSAGLLLLAQAGFDDISGSFAGIGDTGAPTIDAYVLGLRYEGESGLGPLSAYAEAGYTHWLWGNYDGRDKHHDQNPFMRFIFRFPTDAGAALLPLTSPYGPGALWLLLKAEGRALGSGLSLGADFLLLRKNTGADLVNADFFGAKPAGRTTFLSLGLPLRFRAGAFALSLLPTAILQDGRFRAEASLGATWSYRKETALGRKGGLE